MLAIKNNMMATNAARHLGQSYDALSKSVERLSSGLRINSAKDDAAGLAVSELVRADVAQLQQASRNGQDAVSMLQTSEGALGVVDDLLVRMKELAEQAATGSYSGDQRTIMNSEYTQLGDEITRIAGSTKFNGIDLLNASTPSVSFHVASGSISFNTEDMRAETLGVNSLGATASDYSSKNYVSSANDTFIAAADISAGTTDNLSVKFGTGNTVSVTLAGDTTLNGLVKQINDEATAQGYSGPVAFAKYDETFKAYRLELKSTDVATTANNQELSLTGTTATGLVSTQFTGADGAVAAPGTVDLTTQGGAANALTALDTAIKTKDQYRAQLGYMMNRLQSAVSVMDIQSENLMAAGSRITDVDVSTEMAAMTRNQVLAQAGISMLGQANQMPQMALKLLG